jgi:signal transduction histidine kinase
MRRTVSSSGASRSARWATAGAAAISLVVAGLLAGLLPGHLPPGGRGPGIFFTTCGFAADAVTLELVDISVDGEPVVGGAGEVRLNAGQTLRIAVACRPPRAGARFRYSFDGGLSWSAATTDSVLAPQLPGSGTHRILLGAVDAQGTWQAESRYLVVRVAGSESAADERPPRAAGGVPWAALVLTALLAVAAGAAGAILFLRRAGPRRSSLARKTVPRGARLVADGAHERTGGRAADRGADAPGAAGHMRSEFAAGAPTGASPATPAGTSAGAPAPARAAAEPPAIDLTDVPREDLEEELTRLRTRVQDLLDATRRLRHANTELRQEVGFLEQSNRELRELQRRKDELMATLAHDIKNPAAAVAQLAELLQSYDLGAQDQQRFIADLMLTASRILRLSQEMSNAMVAEVRTLPLDLKVDSIRPAVETVARIAQYAAARKNITIKVVLSANLPQIEMDGPRIEEVLDNLVSNAVKYSRPDSTVRVDVKGTPSHLTIEVTDAGLGLSQKDLDEAFQFGKKLSNAPTGGEDSTGVGLWVVRKIVEAHRGVVWVRSSPGKGSTFSVMLPTTQR